jgi:hypothetical protein
MTRQPVALGYRPSLPSGAPDPDFYRLQVTSFTGRGIGSDAYSTEYLTFPDKPAATAHAKAIGALFAA